VNPLLPPDILFEEVEKWLGVRYRYGGNSSHYVDCSAFVRNVYWQVGWVLPRTTSEQIQLGYRIGLNELLIGDLIFFDTNRNGVVSHVGIYLGDRKFAHSSSSRGVIISDLNQKYYKRTFLCARRMVW
jgi:cell wall-associated NlpC family hydrolase